MSLSNDRRWQRLKDKSYLCPCCGKTVNGIFDIGYDHPDAWQHASYRKTGGTVVAGRDVLTADLCTIGDTFYLRGLLALPIQQVSEAFCFGPWAQVPVETFRAYQDAFGTEAEASLGPRQGWLANDLPGFPATRELALQIHFPDCATRPDFTLAAPDHPLSRAQSDGLAFDTLLDLYAAFGHDLRHHLGKADE